MSSPCLLPLWWASSSALPWAHSPVVRRSGRLPPPCVPPLRLLSPPPILQLLSLGFGVTSLRRHGSAVNIARPSLEMASSPALSTSIGPPLAALAAHVYAGSTPLPLRGLLVLRLRLRPWCRFSVGPFHCSPGPLLDRRSAPFPLHTSTHT